MSVLQEGVDNLFCNVTPIEEPIIMEPPYTMVIRGAGGGVWVHHVDAQGKPAGGEYNGVHYKDINELFDSR